MKKVLGFLTFAGITAFIVGHYYATVRIAIELLKTATAEEATKLLTSMIATILAYFVFGPMAIGAAKHKSLALPVFIGSGCMLALVLFDSIDILKGGHPFDTELSRWAMLAFIGICLAVFFSFILLIASAFSRREDR